MELGDAHADDRIAQFVTNEVSSRIPNRACLISIDGFDGVGKSKLACHLAQDLYLPLIHLDDYLVRKQDCYLEAIKFSQFLSEINQKTNLYGRVIVEGCLVDAALIRIGRCADFKIYVMRTNSMRSRPDLEWVVEEEVLYSGKPFEELLANEEKESRAGAELLQLFGSDCPSDEGKLPILRRELMQYHCERRPHESADLLIKVVRAT